jgi:hypothetical protein
MLSSRTARDTQARLPVIDQRRKWAKHIEDYFISLESSGEKVHTSYLLSCSSLIACSHYSLINRTRARTQLGCLNLAHGYPRKIIFVPDDIKEVGGTLRKLKLDDNLLGSDPVIVYDRQGNEQESIEPLSFQGDDAVLASHRYSGL